MTRRALLAVVLASSSLGFAHAALTTEAPRTVIERYEDGSGRELLDGRVVRVFDAGTFPWDCSTDGNGVCGP